MSKIDKCSSGVKPLIKKKGVVQRYLYRSNGGTILSDRLCGVLAVTRAFGDFSLKKAGLTAVPDIKKIELRLTHKYLIIGSDGLWDFIDISKVHKNIKQEGDAENIARFLTKAAI
jgi:serine/threonine protein phosphatase PrpC